MTKEEREAYTEKVNREVAELAYRLSTETDWLSASQSDRVWGYAWREGHASGLYEVENVYREVAELFRPL